MLHDQHCPPAASPRKRVFVSQRSRRRLSATTRRGWPHGSHCSEGQRSATRPQADNERQGVGLNVQSHPSDPVERDRLIRTARPRSRTSPACRAPRAYDRAVIGRGLLAAGAVLALASCGSTTTKTVTKRAPAPSPAPVTSTTTQPATSTATASTTTSATATTTVSVYFAGVVGRARQRPASLELTGDGTLFVSGVQWSSWGGPTATGSGNAQYHGCNPNCAEAPAHSALVSIRLTSMRACSGRHYYSSLVLTLNSGQLLDKEYLQRSWSPC
jgi:hypothetical protein